MCSPREIRQGEEIAWYADGDSIVRNEHNPSIAYAYGIVYLMVYSKIKKIMPLCISASFLVNHYEIYPVKQMNYGPLVLVAMLMSLRLNMFLLFQHSSL